MIEEKNNILGIVTDPGVGGTFLTWSLHYLAGHSEYYFHKQDSWTKLTENPLTKINSHNFTPNQPGTLVNYYNTFNKLNAVDTELFHCLYFHNFLNQQDTAEAVEHLQSSVDKGIILSLDPHSLRYSIASIPRCGGTKDQLTHTRFITDAEEIWKDHSEHFFGESLAIWNELKLTDVWDKREFYALNVDYKTIWSINDKIDDTDSHFYTLNPMDLFCTFDTTVYKLFDYLDHSIDPRRFEQWRTVYNNWKQIHYDKLQFTWYFDNIIYNIIHGRSQDLERFNLDLLQEASIQRVLIYDYGLNLKTWQLEKFINTQQLHNLLEPNCHPI